MSESKKICRAICPGAIRCNESPLLGKGYCAEHEKEFSCAKCEQEIWEKGVNIRIGDEHAQKIGTYQKRSLCWNCWEKEKDNWKEKFRAREVSVFNQIYYSDGQPATSFFLKVCLICDNWYFMNKFLDTCSANCQKQYDNLSSEEKSNLKTDNQIKSNQIKSNQIKSNQIKSNQIKSNQIKSNQIKSNQNSEQSVGSNPQKNYLPWVLGGVVLVSLIGIIACFLVKKNKE